MNTTQHYKFAFFSPNGTNNLQQYGEIKKDQKGFSSKTRTYGIHAG
jgi:hypothetical protein